MYYKKKIEKCTLKTYKLFGLTTKYVQMLNNPLWFFRQTFRGHLHCVNRRRILVGIQDHRDLWILDNCRWC